MTLPSMSRVFRAAWPAVSLCLLLVVIVFGASSRSPALQRTMTTVLINVILVVGLYLFVGNSGVFSFGHAAFMAIGAYTTAILTIPPATKQVILRQLPEAIQTSELPTIVAVLIGGLVAALVAIVVAVPIMRLVGIAVGIGTLAVLIIVNVVITNWSVLGRDLVGIPVDTTMWGALVWACLAVIAAYVFQSSRLGLRLRASREDDVAAEAGGINVRRMRRIAFVISAFIVGVGGGLFGHALGAFTPEAFYFSVTFLMVTMLIVGGLTSLSGAVIGTLAVSAFSELLRRVEQGFHIGSWGFELRPGLASVGLAVVLFTVMVFRPSGITGNREIIWPFRSGHGTPPE